MDVSHHTCQCRHELDITALTGCLEREEKARSEEAAEHATSAAALQQNIADLQVQNVTSNLALHEQLNNDNLLTIPSVCDDVATSRPSFLVLISPHCTLSMHSI